MQAAVSMSERLGGSSIAPPFLGASRQDKRPKKVRFDSTAVDNEYKMRSRQNRTPSIAIAASSQKTEIFPPSWSLASGTAANMSRRINSPSAWPLSTDIRPPETKRQYWETDLRHSAQPPWAFYPLTQTRSLAPLPRTEPREFTVASTSEYRRSAKRPANSAAKRDKVPRGKSTSHVPPKVPDAPSSQNQRPPPTPRPARLSTPDLMDIGGEMFCACDSNVYGKGYVSAGMQPLAKMDAQLEAARAHMKHKV